MKRVAIAQIAMRWCTSENLDAIVAAMELAYEQGAEICAFSELAVTGFHREIAREAVPAAVEAATRRLSPVAPSFNWRLPLELRPSGPVRPGTTHTF